MIPIENPGNYLVRAHGDFELIGPNGEIVAEGTMEPESIYGGYQTLIVIPMPENLSATEYGLSLAMGNPESKATA